MIKILPLYETGKLEKVYDIDDIKSIFGNFIEESFKIVIYFIIICLDDENLNIKSMINFIIENMNKVRLWKMMGNKKIYVDNLLKYIHLIKND